MSARITTDQSKNLQILEPDRRWQKSRPGKKEIAHRLEVEKAKQKIIKRAEPIRSPLTGRYVFIIEPNTKPRQTRSDKWKKRPCVLQYRAFADELRKQAKEMGYSLGETLNVDFIVAMPDSWSKKKKDEMNGTPHRQTPDVDNFLKAVFDSLAKQDKTVWRVEASKTWGHGGAIIIKEF